MHSKRNKQMQYNMYTNLCTTSRRRPSDSQERGEPGALEQILKERQILNTG